VRSLASKSGCNPTNATPTPPTAFGSEKAFLNEPKYAKNVFFICSGKKLRLWHQAQNRTLACAQHVQSKRDRRLPKVGRIAFQFVWLPELLFISKREDATQRAVSRRRLWRDFSAGPH
jgi:hypothetical protein